MSWDYLLVQVTNGAVIGVIYALIAVGVTLIFSILKIVNFAHGDLYMLGGYCAYYVIEYGGVPPLAAMVVAMAALFLGAMILERLMLTPLYSDATERKDEYGLIVTFGLAYFLRNTAVIAFGPFPLKPPSFIPGVQRIGNVIVTNDRLVAGGVGVALIVGLLYFMKRTIWGQALDAVSQSRDAAAIVGINAQRFNSFAFGFGAALAAAAGALVAPIFSLAPDMGVLPNIHAYVIVILGGMGSVGGSIIEGLLLGAGALAGEIDELRVAVAHARAHERVVAGGVGLVLEHQLVAVAEQQLLVGPAHGLQRVLAVSGRAPGAVVVGGPRKGVGDALEAAIDGGEEQLALVGEEAEHVRLGHAHPPRDALDGRAVQATVGELVDGGGDQLLTPLGRRHPPATLPGRPVSGGRLRLRSGGWLLCEHDPHQISGG